MTPTTRSQDVGDRSVPALHRGAPPGEAVQFGVLSPDEIVRVVPLWRNSLVARQKTRF